MLKRLRFLILILLALLPESYSQSVDTTSFTLNTRLSFYSWEKEGDVILHIPSLLQKSRLDIHLLSGDKEIATWNGIPNKKLLVLKISLEQIPGNYPIIAKIRSASGKVYDAKTELTLLNPKSNEVKTDRLTGGLIVNRRQFFPFGFYCYSPVGPEVAEEEVVKGFNMISPYQKIVPSSLGERKSYMDRCAQLGMKVHYNLLSVSGGGGVASRIDGISEREQQELLIGEIKAFMDHPALLSWYISDEPNGSRIEPSRLERIYELVKSIDPWHPVSIVFMAPFRGARDYSDAMDIVMADPYPVPDHSITLPGEVATQLKDLFAGRKPVWIVPQAFGGGELWSREPTVQEIRSMTYQSIAGGARGIQYFIRQGPNSFPKSTTMWDECGRIAQEINSLTPWLLSDEPANDVRSNNPNILVMSALHDGQLMIIAVNRVNAPANLVVRITGKISGTALVLFENRMIRLSGNSFADMIPAYGSQVYLVETGVNNNRISPFKGNLMADPGFEDISSPVIPASCYAWNEGDRGATFFLDSREHVEGSHSLRIITPVDNMGPRLRFFPVKVSPGKTYGIYVKSKSDTTIQHSAGRKSCQACFETGFTGMGMKRFHPGSEWKDFVTFVTIPENMPPGKINVILRVPCQGVVWFDMLQVFEATDINKSLNPGLNEIYFGYQNY